MSILPGIFLKFDRIIDTVKSILAFLELLVQCWAFRNDTRAQAQSEMGANEAVGLRDLLTQRSVWVISIFYFFYQCVEGRAS